MKLDTFHYFIKAKFKISLMKNIFMKIYKISITQICIFIFKFKIQNFNNLFIYLYLYYYIN